MKFSVALCTYNGALFLEEQLESILNQSLPPDELIIVDDCSTDRTLDIIKSTQKSSPVINLYQNPARLGSTKNFEKAIRLCSGDIILTADQDDIWKPGKLQVVSNIFTNHPQIGYVFSDALLVDVHQKPLGINLWESLGFKGKEYQMYLEGKPLEVLLKRNVVTGATMAFKASLREFILPVPEEWVHDGWIATLAAGMDIAGVPVPETLILYRQHPKQQIGAHRSIFTEVRKTSLKDSASGYRLQVKAYQALKERIMTVRDETDPKSLRRMELLDQKIAHLSKRELIHRSSGWLKFRTVIGEMKRHHYKQYSNGWKSIARDLFF